MNTYSSLKTSIASWLARDDLSSYLDDFIDITESRVNKLLRLRAQENNLSLTVSSGNSAVSLPTDFLELRSLYRDGNPQSPMEYLTPEQLNNKANTAKAPNLYSIRGTAITLAGPTDADYTLKGTYYAKFSALDSSNTSTWLTANAPEVMLYGCLKAGSDFIRDEAQSQKWEGLFQQAVAELIERDENSKIGPIPTMRSERTAW